MRLNEKYFVYVLFICLKREIKMKIVISMSNPAIC